MKISVMYIFALLLIASCSNCEPWGNLSRRAYAQVKALHSRDSAQFEDVRKALGKHLDGVNSNFEPSAHATWTTERLVDSQQSPHDQLLLRFFKTNELDAGLIFNANMVFFYPVNDLQGIGEDGSCPAFSHEIVYVRNNEMPKTNGYNSIWYKVADYWFLRTSVAQL